MSHAGAWGSENILNSSISLSSGLHWNRKRPLKIGDRVNLLRTTEEAFRGLTFSASINTFIHSLAKATQVSSLATLKKIIMKKRATCWGSIDGWLSSEWYEGRRLQYYELKLTKIFAVVFSWFTFQTFFERDFFLRQGANVRVKILESENEVKVPSAWLITEEEERFPEKVID